MPLEYGKIRDQHSLNKAGGYLGEYIDTPNRASLYNLWFSMLSRCSTKTVSLYHRYGGRGVYVSEEWKNFNTFLIWYEDGLSELAGCQKEYSLDKDILGDGLCYSPTTCCIIPKRINSMLSTSNKIRGGLPIGVHYNTSKKKYVASLKKGDAGCVMVGRYNSVEEAFLSYKTEKEKYIKEVADIYFNQSKITREVRDGLYNWNVIPYPA